MRMKIIRKACAEKDRYIRNSEAKEAYRPMANRKYTEKVVAAVLRQPGKSAGNITKFQ